MKMLFENDAVFELASELETINETLQSGNHPELLKQLQTGLLFQWMQMEDEMDDYETATGERCYIHILTGEKAVDCYVLSRLSPMDEPEILKTKLQEIQRELSKYKLPGLQAQLMGRELEAMFHQLERELGFCSRFLQDKPLPILRLGAVFQMMGTEVEAQYTVQKMGNGQYFDQVLLYHQSGEKMFQRYSLLCALSHLICCRLTGEPSNPPSSFRMIEQVVYGTLALHQEEQMRRFQECFAYMGAKLVKKTYCFPLIGISKPDSERLVAYFKSL